MAVALILVYPSTLRRAGFAWAFGPGAGEVNVPLDSREREANASWKGNEIKHFPRIERFGSRFLTGNFHREAAQSLGP